MSSKRNKEKDKQRYEQRKAIGICLNCNNKAVLGRTKCQTHLDNSKANSHKKTKEEHALYMREYRKNKKCKARETKYRKTYTKTKKDLGVCFACKAPADLGSVYCVSHRAEAIIRSHKYHQKPEAQERRREVDRRRRREDIQYYLTKRLRTRLGNFLSGNIKAGSAIKDLGCSVEQLIAYLESKFQPGMDWINRGVHGWHIDHIVPLASFNLSDPEQFARAVHYTNLQPLWARDNLAKGTK